MKTIEEIKMIFIEYCEGLGKILKINESYYDEACQIKVNLDGPILKEFISWRSEESIQKAYNNLYEQFLKLKEKK